MNERKVAGHVSIDVTFNAFFDGFSFSPNRKSQKPFDAYQWLAGKLKSNRNKEINSMEKNANVGCRLSAPRDELACKMDSICMRLESIGGKRKPAKFERKTLSIAFNATALEVRRMFALFFSLSPHFANEIVPISLLSSASLSGRFAHYPTLVQLGKSPFIRFHPKTTDHFRSINQSPRPKSHDHTPR